MAQPPTFPPDQRDARARLDLLLGSGGAEVLEAIYDGILIADSDSVVLYVNSEYTRITGVQPAEVIGRRLEDVRNGAALPAVIRTGVRRAGVLRQDGASEYVVDMAPIQVNGHTVGGVSVVKDLTEIQSLNNEIARLKQHNSRLRRSLGQLHTARYTFANIVTQNPLMLQMLEKAQRMAHANADMLLLGESGTGKEVLAQAIHNYSNRAGKPFLALNCATLTSELVESELFGYVDGAFTGAKRGGKEGIFEVADGGTLFLDEISELSLTAQAKLLRVLQERMVRRVGGTGETPLDVRVIAASNRDLLQLSQQGLFRMDLYYRINILQIELPPLRARTGDIPLLAALFARNGTHHQTDRFTPEALALLEHHTWPGNVRELRNAVEYALYLSGGHCIEAAHLPSELTKTTAARQSPQRPKGTPRPLAEVIAEAESGAISDLLREYGTDLAAKRRIAALLGVSLSTLYAKIERHGIPDPAPEQRKKRPRRA